MFCLESLPAMWPEALGTTIATASSNAIIPQAIECKFAYKIDSGSGVNGAYRPQTMYD